MKIKNKLTKELFSRKYKPKIVQYVRLTEFADNEENLKQLFDELARAKKQLETLMSFIHISKRYDTPVPVKKVDLQKSTNTTSALINQMVRKY